VDNADNEGAWMTHIFQIDTDIPSNLAIVINSGSNYATTKTVVLTLSATDEHSGITEMSFKNNDDAWSEWIPYTEGFEWELPSSIVKNDEVTIWFKVRDQVGNEATAVSSSIVYDPDREDLVKPIISDLFPEIDSKIIDRKPVISCKIIDTDSGIDISSLLCKLDNREIGMSKMGEFFQYEVKEELSLGEHTVYIRIGDNNGNIMEKKWKFSIIKEQDDSDPGDLDDDMSDDDMSDDDMSDDDMSDDDKTDDYSNNEDTADDDDYKDDSTTIEDEERNSDRMENKSIINPIVIVGIIIGIVIVILIILLIVMISLKKQKSMKEEIDEDWNQPIKSEK